jgi:hypothetical protein
VEDRPEDREREGGASAIGHPLGASGGRILGTLAQRLVDSGTGGASPRSPSVSARRWPWCWRTSRDRVMRVLDDAAVVARDIAPGPFVNLGIGRPTLVADHLTPGPGVVR